MRSLKVMTWINLNPRKLGTLEEYCVVLSEELGVRGHSSLLAFSTLPPQWLSERFCAAGAQVISIELSDTLRMGLALLKTTRRYQVDVIHCTFFPLSSALNFFMRVSSATTIILSDQASRYPEHVESYKKFLLCVKNRILTSFVDLIIADAKFIRDKLVLEDYVNAAKVITLYNGVNLNRFKPGDDGKDIRKEFAIRPDSPVVTTVAWAIPEKGVDTYLRAAKEVLKRFANAVFLVVGDGPLLDSLKHLAVELGISERVVFTGLRNDTDAILRATDVAVLLSTWEEAFSFSMLEAMASGKPLVASDIGAIPEAVDHGRTGFLVRPGDHTAVSDAIITLLSDKELSVRMGKAARQKCEEFYDLRVMAKKTVDIYETMCV
jgi:glycosyltransferase involved in cell wall biosynthesis